MDSVARMIRWPIDDDPASHERQRRDLGAIEQAARGCSIVTEDIPAARDLVLSDKKGLCLATTDTLANQCEMIDPDARLMLRVRDDDAQAFEELVRRYQGRLLAIFHNTLGNREQAEDLVQEVFLRVFRARRTYVADAKFSTWLFTIAHNVAKNAKRTKARRREVTVVGDESGPMPANPLEQMAQAASGLLPTRQVDRMERAEMVRMAMETLNERQRLAVLLSKFEGMSYADIGATMGLSTPAIKSLLTRARNNLRIVLEPYIEQGEALSDFSNDGSVS